MTDMILCPTRGGQDSYPNQDKAIALAKERGVELLFLYVTNVEFLGLTAAPILVDVEHELDEMGEFMLMMAQERADQAEVTSSTIVKHGQFQEVLVEVINEYNISTVVMGFSTGGTGVVTESYIQGLVDEIGSKTGVEFIIVDKGEIISTHSP
jgi:nucleotide-binding universal stress UspA family protein